MALPALLLLLGAGAARACSADRVRIGPHDYRRVHSIADNASHTSYNLVNHLDLLIMTMYVEFLTFYPKVLVKVASPQDNAQQTGAIMRDLINQDNHTYFLASTEDEIRKGEWQNVIYQRNLTALDTSSSWLSRRCFKRLMRIIKHSSEFVTDLEDNLLVHISLYTDYSLDMDLHRKVYCMGYNRATYYFYNGLSVDSLDVDTVENGPRVEFYVKNPLDMRSMVFDSDDNHYICHSKGIMMANKRVPGGLEEFGNFTDCQGMAFFRRHVYLKTKGTFHKFQRCADLAPRPLTPPSTTRSTTRTTRTTRKTTRTTAGVRDDPAFIRHDGHTTDYVIPLIVFGYLVAALSLFGCLGYLMFNFTEKRCADLTSRFPCWADGDSDSEC